MPTDYSDELTRFEQRRLDDAVRKAGAYDRGNTIDARYSFYRRKGFNKADSLAFTLCFIRNTGEQAERRLAHDTGAQGWRELAAERWAV